SSRRRHTRSKRDWSSDVCSSDLIYTFDLLGHRLGEGVDVGPADGLGTGAAEVDQALVDPFAAGVLGGGGDGLGAHPAHTPLGGEIGRASCRDTRSRSVSGIDDYR